MATTALDEEKKRKALGQSGGLGVVMPNATKPSLADQIPTGGPAGWTGGNRELVQPQSDLSRNIQNTAVAMSGLSGVGPIASLAGQSGRMATGLAGLTRAGQAANAAVQTANGITSMQPSAVAEQVANAPAAEKPLAMGASLGTSSQSQRGEGSIPGTPAPATPAAPTTTNQGMGIVRVDTPGASPLFTNMPTGDQSNVNMMARGTPSAQNVGAMNALAARYAGGAPAAAQPQQPIYGGMASMGTGTNTGGFGILDANYQRERALRMDAADSRNPGESKRAYEARIAGAAGALNTFRGEQTAAPRLAAAQKSADAKTQADMALASRKMAFDEAQGGARMGLDAFRLQDEASTNALRRKAAQADLDTKAQLDAARQEYLAAGDDPAKQKAATKKLAVLNGKSKDDEWGVQVTPATKNLDGTMTPGSVYKYNKATGEVVPVQGMEATGQQAAKPNPTLSEWMDGLRKANPGKNLSDAELKARYEMKFGAQQ